MAKVSKQAEGDRNRARAGWVGTGRAGKLTGGGRWRRHPTEEVKRSAAPGCKLPDETRQNKNLIFFNFIQSQLSINFLL